VSLACNVKHIPTCLVLISNYGALLGAILRENLIPISHYSPSYRRALPRILLHASPIYKN
jgi:hypothetical protein